MIIIFFFFFFLPTWTQTRARSFSPQHLKGSPHISGFQTMCSPDGSPTPAHSSSCWRQSCQRTSPRRSGLWARNVKDSKQMQVTWNSCTEPKQLSTKAIDRRHSGASPCRKQQMLWILRTLKMTRCLLHPWHLLNPKWKWDGKDFVLECQFHFGARVKAQHSSEQGYTHCLIRGLMSLPETLEMDLRKAWVDSSIWLHIWLWYFWEEAVLARLRSLLKTCRESGENICWKRQIEFSVEWNTLEKMLTAEKKKRRQACWPAAWTPCWFCSLSASSPGGPCTGTSCSTPRTACEGAWWRSEGVGLD